MTYSLATERWISCLMAEGGYRDLSLSEVFADSDSVVGVSTGSPLDDAAINRLLLACAVAAKAAGLSASDWVDAHAADFDIFDPVHPFCQFAALSNVPLDKQYPLSAQRYDFSAVASGYFGSYSSYPASPDDSDAATPAESARLLLVRNMYSSGGLGAAYAKYVTPPKGHKPMGRSPKKCPHYSVPFLWLARPTLSATLETMVERVTAGSPKLGEFHFTWTGDQFPGDEIGEPGILDVLTAPVRAMLLHGPDSDGMVRRLSIGQGVVLPDPISKESAEVYRDTFRHTLWYANNDSKPKIKLSVRSVRAAESEGDTRRDWLHLIECLKTPDSPSILSVDGEPVPDDATVCLTSLAANLGTTVRIDGVVDWRFRAPKIDRTGIDALYDLNRQVSNSSLSSLAAVVSTARSEIRGDDGRTRQRNLMLDRWRAEVGRTVLAAIYGDINIEQAQARMARSYRDEQVRQIAGTNNPHVSARVLTKQTPEWMADLATATANSGDINDDKEN